LFMLQHWELFFFWSTHFFPVTGCSNFPILTSLTHSNRELSSSCYLHKWPPDTWLWVTCMYRAMFSLPPNHTSSWSLQPVLNFSYSIRLENLQDSKLLDDKWYCSFLQNGMVIRGQNAISHPLVKDPAGKLPHAVNKVGLFQYSWLFDG
jgi:hypothetical protein